MIRPSHQFKVIKISISPEDIHKIVSNKFDCTGETKQTNAYSEAKKQSLNIFNNSNLTKKDQEEIELLKQILTTVEFTN